MEATKTLSIVAPALCYILYMLSYLTTLRAVMHREEHQLLSAGETKTLISSLESCQTEEPE